VMTPEYLEKIMKEYRIDYVVHGNDPCIVDGKVCVRERDRRQKRKEFFFVRERRGKRVRERKNFMASHSCFSHVLSGCV